ncbi:hypothetical protein S7711_04476 [Stachybotrys chartarum IBT 7711]|uniref:Uncharacterized protein n=1 Tax=Stachybotrys chartarum (strain CBS 109288 / IBT 7711) TaxID=1280523 RepID=A0A084BA59_STACB|nr:hypothetical protein S7711_04476 [Stachybotrys chartarum IBT 7711]
MSTADDESATVQGWVVARSDRGTSNILYGCLIVLFSAVWTLLHLNLPAKGDSTLTVYMRRLRWGMVSIIAPDFLTLIAAAQWHSAKQNLRRIKELSRSENWTMSHVFYANAGGYLLETTDTDRFPVNASSIHYLVSRGFVELPSTPHEEIQDKSNSDALGKGLTLLQCVWFVMQSVARAIEHLPLAPIELFTLAFIMSTAMTYYFWWQKPQHVGTATLLRCDVPVSSILMDAGLEPDAAFENTPFDFIEKQEERYSRRGTFANFDLERGYPASFYSRREPHDHTTINEKPEHHTAVTGATSFFTSTESLPKSQASQASHGTAVASHNRPLRRIPDDAIMPAGLPLKMIGVLLIPSISHSLIHLLGWNLRFPTQAEQNIWRSAVCTLAGTSFLSVGIVRVLARLGYQGRYSLTWVWVTGPKSTKGFAIWDVLLSLCTLILVVARLLVIVEVCISLRELPAKVYVNVSWTNLIPHVA